MTAGQGTGKRATARVRDGDRGRAPGAVGEPELRQLPAGLTAVRDGDFGTRLPADSDGLLGEIASVFNGMVDQLSLFTFEVTRVAREVGTDGRRAGHPPPVLVRGGEATALPLPGGILLGATAEAAYEEYVVTLEPEDRLLMYTDGLIERRDLSVQQSLEHLLTIAQEPAPELDKYLDRLLTHSRSDTDERHVPDRRASEIARTPLFQFPSAFHFTRQEICPPSLTT